MFTVNNFFSLSKNQLILFVSTLIFSIFSAIRIFGLDRDYLNYKKFFINASIQSYDNRFEPGFQLFTNTFILLFDNNSFILFLFFISFISLYLKFSILQNGKYFFLTTLIYIMLILPQNEMMQIRTALATAFMYWALYKTTHSGMKLFKRITFVAVGISMHYSVVIIAPFIIFDRMIYKIPRILTIFFIIVLFPSFINLALEIASNYIGMVQHYFIRTNHSYINLFSSRNIIFTLIILIGLINIKKIPNEKLPWFYVSLSGLMIWYGLLWIPVAAHRFFEITIFSYLIWIPSLPRNYKIISFL